MSTVNHIIPYVAPPWLTASPQVVSGRLNKPSSEVKASRWEGTFSWPALLWIGLWFSINTGHWVLRQAPTTIVGWFHVARTVFPFFVLFITGLFLSQWRSRRLLVLLGPARLWFVYGVISLLACVSSPSWLAAVYWSGVYLSVFPALLFFLDERDPLGSIVRLNRINFVCTALFLLIMLIVAKKALFVGSGLDTSAYGVLGRASTVAEMPMSRSSGLARFGAVVGIIAFVYLCRRHGWRRVLWVAPFLLSTVFLYTLQSRGAILAYAASITVLIVAMSFESRRILLIPIVLLLGIITFADRIPFDRIEKHIARDASPTKLRTLGGRTSTWHKAGPMILDSPAWGWGMQADRYLLKGEHVHNTYLYTLLTTGILGTIAFVGGLAWAWLLMFRALREKILLRSPLSDSFVYEAMGILTFFTVRSIPEVSGALFGVDYMLMLPVLVYLGLLNRRNTQYAYMHCAKMQDMLPL